MKEKEYMKAVETTWVGVLDRYQRKIGEIRAGLQESDERNQILNIIDADLPILFKKYEAGKYSVEKVKDDLEHTMRSIVDKESNEYLAYRTIWEMVDARHISL